MKREERLNKKKEREEYFSVHGCKLIPDIHNPGEFLELKYLKQLERRYKKNKKKNGIGMDKMTEEKKIFFGKYSKARRMAWKRAGIFKKIPQIESQPAANAG